MRTTTTAPARPNVDEMFVVHRVFRREFTAMPDIVRRVEDGDVARAVVVADYVDLVLGGLHMHHVGEDEVLWPRLLERAAPSTGLVETMQEQHERVDAHAARVTPLLAEWRHTASSVRGEQLARAVEGFTADLFTHLDLEEREVLPLVSQHITVAEWNSLGEHGRDTMSLRRAPLLFGALLEEADERERAFMLAPLPAPLRVYLETLGARRYRRWAARVRQ